MHSRPACSAVTQHRSWPKLIIKTSLVSVLVTLAYFWITNENQQHSYIPDKTYKLTILNTSELAREYNNDTAGMNDQLVQRQALINKIRREVETDGGRLLLLSGGELSTDNDILSLKQLNQLGYNAMAVSPLLFDEPLINIRTQEATANFPFLSANLYESETGRPVFDAYALFDFDGLRVAVMGLTRPGSLNNEIAEYRRGIELIDPELAASELLPYLRRQADIVIVATHVTRYPVSSKPGSKTVLPVSRMAGIDLLVGNSLPATDDNYRITEAAETAETAETNTPLNISSCCSTIRRIDLEFRNGELKKTNSVHINLASKIESDHGY